MEHKMLWGTLVVGGAGWLCLLLLASRGARAVLPAGALSPGKPPPRDNAGRAFMWLSLALPIAVWLATLPTKAPFSAGQGWGRGFLLGGVLAFIGAFVAQRGRALNNGAANGGRMAATTSLFAALILVCVPLLWMRHAIIEALLGAALGWVVVSLVWVCGVQPHDDAPATADSPSTTLGLLNGAGFVTALCSVAALGVYRDFVVADVARGTHSAVAVTIAASIALSLLFGTLLSEAAESGRTQSAKLERLFQGLTVFLCAIVPLGIGFLMATKVLDDLNLFYCLAVGCVLGLLGWGLVWDSSRQSEEARSQATMVSPVAILVALCAFMLAYSLMQGFGVGLMLIAAWPISLLLLPVSSALQTQSDNAKIRLDVAQTISLLATFLAVLLVSRVFATRFRADLRGVNLVDQFALFGFLAGATVPPLLASLWFGAGRSGKERANSSPSASLLRLGSIGILALLLPGAMIALWGIKIVPAFFAGMALMFAGFGSLPNARTRTSATALFALALSLLVAQWMTRLLPLAEMSRAQRMHFLLWGLGGSILFVLVVDFAARLLFWLHNRSAAGLPTKGVSP